MARPKKAVVDYFPHYVAHGRTMFTIENKYGNDGYSFWFKLLELLGSTEQHFIDCNDTETWEYLLAKTRFSEDTAYEIIDLFSKLGAIDKELWQYKIIWSENFVENLSTVYCRREVDVYNKHDLLSYCMQKYPLNEVSVNINPQSKVKESKVKESIENKTPLESAINDFKLFRKSIKAPMTDRAVQLLHTELNKLASDDETKIAILNQSIVNSWKGVFALKQDRPPGNKSGNVFFDILREEGKM